MWNLGVSVTVSPDTTTWVDTGVVLGILGGGMSMVDSQSYLQYCLNHEIFWLCELPEACRSR